MHRFVHSWPVLLGVAVAVLGGCAETTARPRYRVSGTVTCGGKPVPHGEILFSPDGRAGNTGPQGIAIIRDGRFDTAGTRAPGVAGGPTVVRVTALKTAGGGLIAEHEFTLELPKTESEQVIDIPEATKAAPQSEI
jgi:hypothetical protein